MLIIKYLEVYSGLSNLVYLNIYIYIVYIELFEYITDISSNPDKYTADTHINGIQNGTDSATGISLQIQGATGSQINVKSLFVLESKPIPTSQDGYTRRTFIRLNAPLDRDVGELLLRSSFI